MICRGLVTAVGAARNLAVPRDTVAIAQRDRRMRGTWSSPKGRRASSAGGLHRGQPLNGMQCGNLVQDFRASDGRVLGL